MRHDSVLFLAIHAFTHIPCLSWYGGMIHAERPVRLCRSFQIAPNRGDKAFPSHRRELMSVFEAGMLICFGAAWPTNIAKSLKSRTAKGKSLPFLIIVMVGYVSVSYTH